MKMTAKSPDVVRRDQRAFRCGFTRARRGRNWKNAVAFASVWRWHRRSAVTAPLKTVPRTAFAFRRQRQTEADSIA